MRSKNSPRRPSRMEYVMARMIPASAKSGATSGPRAEAGAGLRVSRMGGIERAGATRTGRGGATWRMGSGDGTTWARNRAAVAWALRAGVLARARLTTVANLECLGITTVFRRLAPLVVWVLAREGRDGRRDPADLCRVLLDRPFTGNLLARKPQRGKIERLGADFPTRIVAEPSPSRQPFLGLARPRVCQDTRPLTTWKDGKLEDLVEARRHGVAAAARDGEPVIRPQYDAVNAQPEADPDVFEGPIPALRCPGDVSGIIKEDEPGLE